MAQELYVGVWHYEEERQVASFGTNYRNLQIRCSLPGWLQRMTFSAIAPSIGHAAMWVDQWAGYRCRAYSNTLNLPMGRIYAIYNSGREVFFEVVGAWRSHENERYVTSYSPDITITAFLEAVLDANVPDVGADAANLATNTTEVGDLFFREIEEGDGVAPKAIVEALLSMSDADSATYDYWCEAGPFNRSIPRRDRAKYVKRQKTAALALWNLRLSDLQESGIEASIFGYRSTIRVKYDKVTGTTTNSSIYLIDSTKNFVDEGVRIGDMATNLTRSSTGGTPGTPTYGFIGSIATTINDNDTLGSLTGYNWWQDSNGDDYSITLNTMAEVTATATATPTLWTAVGETVEAKGLNATQATQMAQELLDDLSNPVLMKPITVGSGKVRDFNGAEYPSWAMLWKPAYFRITDLYAEPGARNVDLIARRGAWSTAYDYDHNSRTLSITPTRPSDRLDTQLVRAGILHGEGIEPWAGGFGPLSASQLATLMRWGPESHFFAGPLTPRWFVEWMIANKNIGLPHALPYVGSGYQGSPYYNPRWQEDRARDWDPDYWWNPDRRR